MHALKSELFSKLNTLSKVIAAIEVNQQQPAIEILKFSVEWNDAQKQIA